MKAVPWLAAPSLKVHLVSKLKFALGAIELQLQTLPGLAEENSTLRTEDSCL